MLDVIVWLGQRGYDIKPELLEIAATAMQVNLARCASQVAPAMAREFRSLVA
ncbi:hypothetical protein D3C87_1891870 [compost metagenome]